MKSKAVHLRPLAGRDIAEALKHYRREGGSALANRWVDTIQEGLAYVGKYPGTGSSRYAAVLQLAGLRFWTLRTFPYLIFYIERDDQVDVWRVLHAQPDIPAWLSGSQG